jgi:hypothetical protein
MEPQNTLNTRKGSAESLGAAQTMPRLEIKRFVLTQ